VYLRIYLPLMTPALTVVAIYTLLLAWNDYLYQFVLLSSPRNMTVSVTQSQLFGDADAPWNAMMAAAIIYALPPIVIFLHPPPLPGGGPHDGWFEGIGREERCDAIAGSTR